MVDDLDARLIMVMFLFLRELVISKWKTLCLVLHLQVVLCLYIAVQLDPHTLSACF